MKHVTAPYLLAPTHPVTVAVIGCGGNGSNMLTALARIHVSLQAIGHAGLMVTAYDDDEVSPANMGRQQFSEAEIGLPKCVVLITRINRFYGLQWQAVPQKWTGEADQVANIVISCVDLVKVRLDIHNVLYSIKTKGLREWQCPWYWMDLGNDAKSGQVYLSTVSFKTSSLPTIFRRYPKLKKQKDDTTAPSCSVAEALRKQDLFINSTLAQFASALLWRLFREGGTDHQGAFINLDTFSVNPIKIQ